jgi:thioredoxin reductase
MSEVNKSGKNRVMPMKSSTAIAIVGAGPYGLSLAAHLNQMRIPFRIFGFPMQVWRHQMPAGMHLKSDGFASDLYDPDRSFTLKEYCEHHRIDYHDHRLPVRLDTFTAYALEFQKRFVPNLEPKAVTEVRSDADGYALRLEDGETLCARAVVIATGISYFGYVPAPLASLPVELCTHSGAHHDLSGFRNRRVLVVGGGASATDLAALLHRAGASVSLASRSPLKFHLPPSDGARSIWQKIRAPNLGLGPGLKSAVYTAVPGLFHRLPQRLRHRIVRHHLGPAGGWFIKDELLGKVHMHEGYTVQAATPNRAGVALRMVDQHGSSREIEIDHVVAATGYRVSVARLNLLEQQLRSRLKLEEESPALSLAFESSAPGLHFIGVASANNFGPVMRFGRGAEYAAARLSMHLARNHSTRKD